MRIGGLIVAAGLSSRMGEFKALLPVGSSVVTAAASKQHSRYLVVIQRDSSFVDARGQVLPAVAGQLRLC
jgi:CTP:molybdopterin cytidylyltransferase MocA